MIGGDGAVGLAGVEMLYRNYGHRARELKASGKQLIGYLCALVPLEIITAAGLVPFRLKGDPFEPITDADKQMETIVCGTVRSRFDLLLKQQYDFLDGLVVPHACDSIARTYPLWRQTLAPRYSHFLNIPHSTDESSLQFFKLVLNTLRTSLDRFRGHSTSDSDLAEAVAAHNRNRAARGMSASSGNLERFKRIYRDIPALVLQSDMVDIGSYDEAATRAQIDVFIEMLDSAKNRK